MAGYRIDALLGRGGMSVVYLAEQVRLGRRVALKVLAPALAGDEGFRERFIRESRRAAELDHPNVIPIFDAGEVEGGDADGLLYIAMRYVEGPDLKSLLAREGALSVGRTIFILEQVAGALDTAHDHNLIHRDVKPANILISEPSDHVYLTDFGVVKHTTTRGLTRTGFFVGTADYAAPEQLEGHDLDRRTDVYALGCVLYECLAGRPPFDRDSEVAVMHAHLTEPPPRITDVNPQLPKALDRVIASAMAKSSDERFATCPDLIEAARAAILQRQPATVEPRAPVHVEPEPPPPSAPAAAAEPPAPAAPPALGRSRGVYWALTAALVALAAAVSGAIVFLVTRSDTTTPAAATGMLQVNAVHRLETLVPPALWKGCTISAQPRTGAVQTAVCLQEPGTSGATPDRWELSSYASGAAVRAAYETLRRRAHVKPNQGQCTNLSWGGEHAWQHGPGKPGGRAFCYFAGDDAVIVWMHEKFGQPSHTDVLGIAREGGSDHATLFDWWNVAHHKIGKVPT